MKNVRREKGRQVSARLKDEKTKRKNGGGVRRLKKEGGRFLGQTTAVDVAVCCRKLAGIRTASTQGKVDDRSLREGGDRRRGRFRRLGWEK